MENKFLDLYVINSGTTADDVAKACATAKSKGYNSVAVSPCNVPQCAELLFESGVKVSCVVGYPFGESYTVIKAAEAAVAISDGADEIEFLVNCGKLKERDLSYLKYEIQTLRGCDAPFGLYLNCPNTTDDELKLIAHYAIEGGADFLTVSNCDELNKIASVLNGRIKLKVADCKLDDVDRLSTDGFFRAGVFFQNAYAANQTANL